MHWNSGHIYRSLQLGVAVSMKSDLAPEERREDGWDS